MIAYRLKHSGQWYGTLNEARDAGRQFPRLMLESLIEQFDVPIHKDGVLALLNGTAEFEPQRQWEFTARGGLVEVNAEGYRV